MSTHPEPTWSEPLASANDLERLAALARERRWGLALVLVGWLHLVAFSACYYLTYFVEYLPPTPYLLIWAGELLGVALIFRLSCGPRPTSTPKQPLERFVVRVWISYFLLAWNLCSMHSLRGNVWFELFPAMASLASFGFLAMTFVLHRRFFYAVLVMFASGLLMASHLPHAYLIFALAWWLVLNAIGFAIGWTRAEPTPSPQARPVWPSRESANLPR